VSLIEDDTSAYPTTLIPGCASAALLFCKGRIGVGDGYWYKDSGISDVACVDIDQTTIGQYRMVYPSAWSYVLADPFTWAAQQTRTWDIVSVDIPEDVTGDLFASLPSWTVLASKYVVATIEGYNAEGDAGKAVPDGWTLSDVIKRAEYDDGRVYHWLVLSA
jgi:hypothetical protein